MAWTPLLIVRLCHCTGSLSQAVLTQPPSLSASPGPSARLPCTLSSGSSVGSYHISWYQRKPGSPPWYLLSCFSGDKDALANVGLLVISGLQSEDEADCDCLNWLLTVLLTVTQADGNGGPNNTLSES
uniref:Ig-like domain-containing protein n=1 Tax=Sus scrofa TaxID=9823 RepID=A0A4X1T0F8_PIG